MKSKITEILNKADIRDVGFCAFDVIKDKLIECRAKSRIPENAKTVICCAFPYKVREEKPENISRYAAVPDYHRILGGILKKSCDELKKYIDGYRYEYFVDNSPIPEVLAASASGLGVIGKNGILITEKYGSFVFLGEIVTDLEIETVNKTKYCDNCGVCKTLCPVALDKKHCLSALSQKKGELDKSEQELIYKNRIVWGCDICAEACPLNQGAELTYIKEFSDGYRSFYTDSEDITDRAYEWRGKKTVDRNFNIIKNFDR